MEPTQNATNPIIRPRLETRIPAKDCSLERLMEFYRKHADWYQWAVDYSLSEADKVRCELEHLRIKVSSATELKLLVECKELELAELESDARSFGDVLETYLELVGDTEPNPATVQMDCFD